MVIFRILSLALCSFVAWRTTRLAVADYLANTGNPTDFDRAIQLEPGDESLLAGRAIFQSEEGSAAPAIDRALLQALGMNPRDAAAWMTLGLRAESRGDEAAAERDLIEAASVDRTFKPAWTLANYYFRANQPEKFRRAIARCLSLIEPKDLQPVSFDPAPVFDLCWRQTDGSKSILDLIPRREQTLIPYLKYLYETNRTDAALETWPAVVHVVDHPNAADADELLRFNEHLITVNRMPEAVAVWNALTATGIAPPEDSGFSTPAMGRGFAWRIQHTPGVFVAESPRALKFEFTGEEPEDCELLWRFAPASPEKTWHLVWQADSSQLDSWAGFEFEIREKPGDVLATCPAMPGSCEFRTAPGTQSVRLGLKYRREPGTTRVKGTLVLSSVRLEALP